MKIKIAKRVPVKENIRPAIGGIYEVVKKEIRGGGRGIVYFVEVGGERVGVFGRECEVICERSERKAIREAGA